MPFRLSRTLVTPWRVFAPAGAAFATLTVFGAVILLEKGMPWRLPAEAVAYGEARHAYEPIHEVSLRESRAGRFVDIGSGITSQAVEVFLWGDSHAMAVVPAVRDLCRQHGVHGLAATHSATPPVIGLHGLSGGPFYADAVEYNQCVLDFIVHNRIPHVVLVARWSFYESHVRDHAPRGSEILRERLQATVDALVAAGSRVYVMQEVPCHPTDVPRALAKAVMAGWRPETLQLPESRYREEMAAANAIVHAVRGPSVQLLDPSPWLTDGRGLCRVTHDGQALYRDDDHLSIAGAMELRPMFDRILVPGMAESGYTRAGTRIIR